MAFFICSLMVCSKVPHLFLYHFFMGRPSQVWILRFDGQFWHVSKRYCGHGRVLAVQLTWVCVSVCVCIMNTPKLISTHRHISNFLCYLEGWKHWTADLSQPLHAAVFISATYWLAQLAAICTCSQVERTASWLGTGPARRRRLPLSLSRFQSTGQRCRNAQQLLAKTK